MEDRYGTLNRLQDQRRVHQELGLREVGDSTTVIWERAGAEDGGGIGAVLAVGYERVLYGDGGPYIEVMGSQVRWEAWPHFHDKSGFQAYYDEYFTAASYGTWSRRWEAWNPRHSDGVLMLYAQRYAVDDRPWAPGAASSPHAFRSGGYADYRPGYFYITTDGSLIATGDQQNQELDPKTGAPILPNVRPPPCRDLVSNDKEVDNEFQGCWDFRMGRCHRGFACKWKHLPH